VRSSLAAFERKFSYFVKNIEKMDTLFEASFSPLTAGGKPWSQCPRTKRFLQLIVSRPSRSQTLNPKP
jgi:DNA topoisomerase-3